MEKYKITHPQLKKVKYISNTNICFEIDGKEFSISLSEFHEIKKEVSFLNQIANSYSLTKFINKNSKEYKYYHDELKENVKNYLIGKTKLNLEKDYDQLQLQKDHIPYMRLKQIYEQFKSFNLIDGNGNVLISSLDDLIEPLIEEDP